MSPVSPAASRVRRPTVVPARPFAPIALLPQPRRLTRVGDFYFLSLVMAEFAS